MENNTESETTLPWQQKLDQDTPELDDDAREELVKTTKDVSIEIQQALRVLTAALGDEKGVKILAEIANSHMPTDPNLTPKYSLTVTSKIKS